MTVHATTDHGADMTTVDVSIHEAKAQIEITSRDFRDDYFTIIKESDNEAQCTVIQAPKSMTEPQAPTVTEQAMRAVGVYRSLPRLKRKKWTHSACISMFYPESHPAMCCHRVQGINGNNPSLIQTLPARTSHIGNVPPPVTSKPSPLV